VPTFALPKRDQGEALRLSSHPKRILVIGGGTLEPLVVAYAHPDAEEVVSIDLSAHSVEILQRRIKFSQIARPFTKLPKIRTFVGDFTTIDTQGEIHASETFQNFDYVIASNVLHHSEDPAHFLAKATQALKVGGTLRVVTYPASSRIWMRATSRWLKLHQVDKAPNLKKTALECVRRLSISHPIRACYESHQERTTAAGITDAFLNACENPLTPLQWQEACDALGLKLVAETQDRNSNSALVDDFSRNTLNVWEKLQIADDSWELCSNPILWFEKTSQNTTPSTLNKNSGQNSEEPRQDALEMSGTFTSSIRREMAQQFSRAEKLLQKSGHGLEEWTSWLAKEIGPRVWPKNPDELLRGLSITEYPVSEILKLSQTPIKSQPNWDMLQQKLDKTHRIYFNSRLCKTQMGPSELPWRQQAEIMELELGPFHNELTFEIK
jgi:SAM-dependent methyltransferase